jgi:uncharacterized membrane protein
LLLNAVMRSHEILTELRESFWFLPSVMVLAAGIGAVVSTTYDAALDRKVFAELGWIWTGSAEGARSVLSAIATSTMTVAGVVYSITVTALAQTSSHFGPRVLRNFTADRGNQIVLGTFVGTFVYCLMVLRTVSTAQESGAASVPYLSVNLGLALAVASIGVLIYFIHHIARGLQVEVLLAGVAYELNRSARSLFPEALGGPQSDPAPADPGGWDRAALVTPSEPGYLQRIDQAWLMRLAERHDLVVRVERRPGDFVDAASPVLLVQSRTPLDRRLAGKLGRCLAVGAYRTPDEDAGYSVQQLVEIAARALSPGMNEIFTAHSCIDWLGHGLATVATREVPAAERLDRHGRLRVIAPPTTFVDLAAMVFGTLRPYAAEQASIAARLLRMIESLAPRLRRAEDEVALRDHALELRGEAMRLENEGDRRTASTCYAATIAALDRARARVSGREARPTSCAVRAREHGSLDQR